MTRADKRECRTEGRRLGYLSPVEFKGPRAQLNRVSWKTGHGAEVAAFATEESAFATEESASRAIATRTFRCHDSTAFL